MFLSSLCCFLNVSGPINAILASFDVLVSHLPKIEEDKGKLGCPTLPEEKATKITVIPCAPIAPNLSGA